MYTCRYIYTYTYTYNILFNVPMCRCFKYSIDLCCYTCRPFTLYVAHCTACDSVAYTHPYAHTQTNKRLYVYLYANKSCY